MGTQVIVPYREEDEKRHLKPMGDLGQIVSMVALHLFPCPNRDHLKIHSRNGISGMKNKLLSA
jgi:hypothetical protein